MSGKDQSFPEDALDTLFSHILANDVVTDTSVLPQRVPLDFSQPDIIAAYRLARQLFTRRLDVIALRGFALTVMRQADVPPEERLPFKYARARFKQVRFAKANFDRRHRYPPLLNLMTTELGHLQDDFKNGRPIKARLQAVLTIGLLSTPSFRLVMRELRDFSPASPAELRDWVQAENQRLQAAMAQDLLTGKQFHELRKIVSRRVSLYDTLRVITPSDALDQVSLFLATLNGLMGGLHDRLIEEKIAGASDYHKDAFPCPPDIRERLSFFLSRN
ncbi:hypothetical protein [Acetobacter conturbans]|uniref:Uncharacterized protein n=1 Tax=Acetobacter conturbans TaxID=1737472 RepID=A0ABX0K0I1_9PROT|nr:hypothetical protein [Acetobacter conturbans]NHN87785.1 hypothetical protein [Acetobacter conturbans]